MMTIRASWRRLIRRQLKLFCGIWLFVLSDITGKGALQRIWETSDDHDGSSIPVPH
jgi:hypothetical protein